MKTKSKFFVLIAAVLLSFGSTANPPKVHNIILDVDTDAITNTNVDETAHFQGQGQGVKNKDFTLTVKPGDVIVWTGVSTSAPDRDKVMIVMINHEGGDEIFERNTLRDTRANPGVVMGTVTNGKDGNEEKYTLSFKVYNGDTQRNGTFHIDPKIVVKM